MNNDKRKDLIIKIILIVIIIILLLHNCYITNKNKNEKQPTGNVDIFEIKCDKEECIVETNKPEKQENTNDKENYDNKPNNNNEKPSVPDTPVQPTEPEEPITPIEPEPTPEPEPEELIVKDKQKTWNENTTARIFTNSMYELKNKIAPESSNTYQFIIKNGTEYNLKYNMEFIESNPYNINMKYKLKKNDTYLIEHYVSASELNISEFLLDSKTSDTYYLEWKWVSSDNDTEIGSTENATYELKIDIKAESYNE